MIKYLSLIAVLSLSTFFSSHAQLLGAKEIFTHADTLRGSLGPERTWWNVLHYDIHITPDYVNKSIKAETSIQWQSVTAGQTLQIDLQQPLKVISMEWRHKLLTYKRDGNAYFVRLPSKVAAGKIETISIRYEGTPHEAVNPPWSGGWVWAKDEKGRPWMSVCSEALGASAFYPCKDHLSDEPDSGATMSWTVPDSLMAVGNGRLKMTKANGNGTTTYTWAVVNPINSYDITTYIGKYVSYGGVYDGVKGKLDYHFWVQDYDLEKARLQFKQVDTMFRSHEYWMGAYPFYEDGYQLVEAPYAGMEHQSAIAYGTRFTNGFMGEDLSSSAFWNNWGAKVAPGVQESVGSGWPLKYDFMLVHESGHEWFGNNITAKDLGDMWIHESFATYSETLYFSYVYGIEAGNDYITGFRRNFINDVPIVGPYGVNKEGSGDMYYKGAFMLHMIRQIIGDTAFRGLLHGLGSTFYHQTVTAAQIENYISQYAHKDLSKVFDQYLLTTMVPTLEYKSDGRTVSYRWTNCVKGFNMPVKAFVGGLPEQWITPTEDWQQLSAGTGGQVIAGTPGADIPHAPVGSNGFASAGDGNLSLNRNFYVLVKKVN